MSQGIVCLLAHGALHMISKEERFGVGAFAIYSSNVYFLYNIHKYIIDKEFSKFFLKNTQLFNVSDYLYYYHNSIIHTAFWHKTESINKDNYLYFPIKLKEFQKHLIGYKEFSPISIDDKILHLVDKDLVPSDESTYPSTQFNLQQSENNDSTRYATPISIDDEDPVITKNDIADDVIVSEEKEEEGKSIVGPFVKTQNQTL
jgi:hypothetical protein